MCVFVCECVTGKRTLSRSLLCSDLSPAKLFLSPLVRDLFLSAQTLLTAAVSHNPSVAAAVLSAMPAQTAAHTPFHCKEKERQREKYTIKASTFYNSYDEE